MTATHYTPSDAKACKTDSSNPNQNGDEDQLNTHDIYTVTTFIIQETRERTLDIREDTEVDASVTLLRNTRERKRNIYRGEKQHLFSPSE